MIADAAAPNILSEAEAAFYTRPQVRSTVCSVLAAQVMTPQEAPTRYLLAR